MATKPPKQHAEFYVENTSDRVIRPLRFEVEDLNISVKINSEDYLLLNYSAYGFALLQKLVSQHSPLIQGQTYNVCLNIHGYFQQDFSAVVVNTFPVDGDKSIVRVGFEVKDRPIDVHCIASTIESLNLISKLVFEHDSEMSYNAVFRAEVSHIRNFLLSVKSHIAAVEKAFVNLSASEIQSKEQGVCSTIAQFLGNSLNMHFMKITEILGKLKEEEQNLHYEYLRNKLEDILYDSPFAHRAFKKPLGYAGDYEMMNLLYRDVLEGKDLFSKCLNKYYTSQAAAQAVKNRGSYLSGKILHSIKNAKKDHVNILSLACGPANEVQKFLCEDASSLVSDKKVTFTLLDNDLLALQNSQTKIKEIIMTRSIKNVSVNYLNIAVKNIIVKGLREEDHYDLIYSAGLFDYFEDRVAGACIKKLFAGLRIGGKLVIGNFDVTNPTRALMESVLDWHLIHRSPEDMIRLGQCVSDDVFIEREESKVNLFAIISKNR